MRRACARERQGYLLEYSITCAVTVTVVYGFEVVDVANPDQSGTLIMRKSLEILIDRAPIAEPRQQVPLCIAPYNIKFFAQCRNLAGRGVKIGFGRFGLFDHSCDDLDRSHLSPAEGLRFHT